MENNEQTHPSFGLISVHRCSSNGTHLFGSDAEHHHFIEVTIHHASVKHDLPQHSMVNFEAQVQHTLARLGLENLRLGVAESSPELPQGVKTPESA